MRALVWSEKRIYAMAWCEASNRIFLFLYRMAHLWSTCGSPRSGRTNRKVPLTVCSSSASISLSIATGGSPSLTLTSSYSSWTPRSPICQRFSRAMSSLGDFKWTGWLSAAAGITCAPMAPCWRATGSVIRTTTTRARLSRTRDLSKSLMETPMHSGIPTKNMPSMRILSVSMGRSRGRGLVWKWSWTITRPSHGLSLKRR